MFKRDYKKPILLIAFIAFFNLISNAQNGDIPPAFGYYKDATRFSQQNIVGSARIRALGGAGVSLGGDISHGILNPAGLGFMRKSEYQLSMGLGFTGTTSSGDGVQGSGEQTRFFLPQLGAVWASSKSSSNGGKWRGGAFSISFNRIADYNSDVYYTENGSNPTSLLNYFEEAAYGTYKSNMDLASQDYARGYTLLSLGEMAYALDLIKPVYSDDDNSYNYYYNSDRDKYGFPITVNGTDTSYVKQRTQMVKTRGGQYETTLAYGGNFDDKFYFGGKIGIQNINYTKTSEYVEIRDQELTYLGLAEEFETTGWGVNLSAGVIWRPIDALRIGATYTSPTWYGLNDYYTSNLTRTYDNYAWDDAAYQNQHFNSANFPPEEGPDYVYNPEGKDLYNPNASESATYNGKKSATHDRIRTKYNMTTPWKASGGISTFFGKKGFLTVDVEYVGNSAINVSDGTTYYLEGTYSEFSQPLNFDGDNYILNEELRNTVNIRAGGEYRMSKRLMLRVGYAYYQDAQKEEYNLGVDKSKQFYTGGLGYRNNKFYADFTVIYSKWKGIESPYQLDDNISLDNSSTVLIYPIIDVDYNRTELQLSIGKRF
ncbi:OmpP1/FadL family transporter [Flammeovirga pectinis]|nr:outer membrane protein transport protein [Flammeovirga pectinis]